MPEEYPPEELQKIYEALPEDLREALFSDETAANVHAVCVENGLEGKNLEIAKYVGYVLLGLLSPNDFEKTIKIELGLKGDISKKVSQEISRSVFYPLKETLESIYKIEIAQAPKPGGKITKEESAKERVRKDSYREPID